jgi:hypothetical protein
MPTFESSSSESSGYAEDLGNSLGLEPEPQQTDRNYHCELTNMAPSSTHARREQY